MVTILELHALCTNTKIRNNLILKQLTMQCYNNTVVTSFFPFSCTLIDVSLCDIWGNTIYPFCSWQLQAEQMKPFYFTVEVITTNQLFLHTLLTVAPKSFIFWLITVFKCLQTILSACKCVTCHSHCCTDCINFSTLKSCHVRGTF